MDFTETDDHTMLRSAVRALAADFGHEYYARCVREDRRPEELWAAAAELGFLSVHLPEEYGGGGAGMSLGGVGNGERATTSRCATAARSA